MAAKINALRQHWSEVESKFMRSEPIRRLLASDVAVEHYARYLRETYFYTRENPQIQALATAWFRGKERTAVKWFLQHALSEVGHDEMALSDLVALGYSIAPIRHENPLPTTVPLISFPFYAIQYRAHVSYLGYLSFLEMLPVSCGGDIGAALLRAGVPVEAMSFLAEHRAVDVHHARLMDNYVEILAYEKPLLDEAIYAMEVTATLFEGMLSGAFAAVDSGARLER